MDDPKPDTARPATDQETTVAGILKKHPLNKRIVKDFFKGLPGFRGPRS